MHHTYTTYHGTYPKLKTAILQTFLTIQEVFAAFDDAECYKQGQ